MPVFRVAGDRTTIPYLTASAPIAVSAFALSAPYRLVVDMPETHFDLANASREMKGLVRSWRAGLFATGRSRIVFDATGPLKVAATRVEPQADGTARVVIDLQSVTAEQFAAEQRTPPAAATDQAPVTKSDRAPFQTAGWTAQAGHRPRSRPRRHRCGHRQPAYGHAGKAGRAGILQASGEEAGRDRPL